MLQLAWETENDPDRVRNAPTRRRSAGRTRPAPPATRSYGGSRRGAPVSTLPGVPGRDFSVGSSEPRTGGIAGYIDKTGRRRIEIIRRREGYGSCVTSAVL